LARVEAGETWDGAVISLRLRKAVPASRPGFAAQIAAWRASRT
jgi:hypothetical protein